jgi:probable rRNA maturation factor
VEDISPDWPDTGEEEFGVFFTVHDVEFVLNDSDRLVHWIRKCIEAEGHTLSRLDFVFCSDPFLLEINLRHLDHDYFTDIITFPLNDDPLIAEIYISVDRVIENASTLTIPFEEELHRVMIHGVLHLCGFEDHEEEDIMRIREKEEAWLRELNKE